MQWWNSFIFAVFGAAILIGSRESLDHQLSNNDQELNFRSPLRLDCRPYIQQVRTVLRRPSYSRCSNVTLRSCQSKLGFTYQSTLSRLLCSYRLHRGPRPSSRHCRQGQYWTMDGHGFVKLKFWPDRVPSFGRHRLCKSRLHGRFRHGYFVDRGRHTNATLHD